MSDGPANAIEVEPEQVAAMLSATDSRAGTQVIDVREPDERDAGHIAGTGHIRLVELSGRAAEVDRGLPVVFYCRVGSRSEMAAQAFRGAGYEAYSMAGGLVRWAQEGRPLEPEDGRVAAH